MAPATPKPSRQKPTDYRQIQNLSFPAPIPPLPEPIADWAIFGGREKFNFGTQPQIQRNAPTRLYKLACQNFDSTRFYLVLVNYLPLPLAVGQSLTLYRRFAIDPGAFLMLDRSYWVDNNSQYQGRHDGGQSFPNGIWFTFSLTPETYSPVPLTLNFFFDAGGKTA